MLHSFVKKIKNVLSNFLHHLTGDSISLLSSYAPVFLDSPIFLKEYIARIRLHTVLHTVQFSTIYYTALDE